MERVELLQSGLELLAGELSGVNTRLDQVKMSGSSFSSPVYARRGAVSPGPSVSSSVPSVSAPSSSASDKDNDSSAEDIYDEAVVDEAFPMCNGVKNDCELLQIYSSGSFCWMKSLEDFPSPSPVPPSVLPLSPHLNTVVALYPFAGEAASNIPMAEGEQFLVTEADQGGWIRVRRLDGRFFPEEQLAEGYVPTAFLQFIA